VCRSFRIYIISDKSQYLFHKLFFLWERGHCHEKQSLSIDVWPTEAWGRGDSVVFNEREIGNMEIFIFH
jgi:hypothetical protein